MRRKRQVPPRGRLVVASGERGSTFDDDANRERAEHGQHDGEREHDSLHTKSRRWNKRHATTSRPTIQPRPCRLARPTYPHDTKSPCTLTSPRPDGENRWI